MSKQIETAGRCIIKLKTFGHLNREQKGQSPVFFPGKSVNYIINIYVFFTVDV